MSECESTIMRMLDRNNLWDPLSFSDRKSLYLKHLRYWNHQLITKKIDLCIFSCVPHGVYDFILFELCKIHKIPTVLFSSPSLIFHTVFISDDWKEPSLKLKNKYLELKSSTLKDGGDAIRLSSSNEAYLKKQSDFSSSPVPYYMAKTALEKIYPPKPISKIFARWMISHSVKSLIMWPNSYKALDLINELIKHLKQDQVRRALKKLYKHLCKTPNIKNKFIYFPLHLQPELTTTPMGGAFVEQALAINLLAEHLPADVYIYVKEHPAQFDYGLSSRNRAFYEEIASIPNVQLIPIEFDTFCLINNCIAVATITGTAGWEGLFRSKPYLMFGHHVYQYAPGVIQIKNSSDAKSALDMILNSAYAPRLSDLRIFLKAVEDVAINADTVDYRLKISHLSAEENIDNLYRGLEDHVKNVSKKNSSFKKHF